MGGWWAGSSPHHQPPSLLPPPPQQPTPACSLALSAVTSWGSQTEPSAPGAREVLSVTGALLRRRLLTWLRARPGSCSPELGASCCGRRLRHGVPGHCGECVSERASVRRGQSPPAWGLGCGRPSSRGPRKGRDPAAAASPGGSRRCHGPPHPKSLRPSSARPPPVGGREENSGHVTRKRDFVDRCVSGAGWLDRCLGEEGDGSRPQASAWADHSEAWERAGERRVTGTSRESCSKFVSSPSSSYGEVWGGAGHASESKQP